MPVDPNIILGIRQPKFDMPDPAEQISRGFALRSLMNKQQMEDSALADDQAIRSAYQQAAGDSKALRGLLQGSGQYKAIQALDKAELEKRDKEASIASHEASAGKTKWETAIAQVQHGSSILSAARDQASYDAARRQIALTISPELAGRLPEQYDPVVVKNTINSGLTMVQKLENERKQAEQGLKEANEPFTAGPNGPVPNTSVQEFLLNKAKKSAPNVSVKTDVKQGESLAGQIGPMMRDSTSIAEGAVKQVDAAQRIIKAVDGKRLFAGPLADQRVTLAQVGQVLGVGGKDDAEKLANTRQAVRGLAELTLQGRQQMKGQGAITESEGKLAEKAMSGDISQLTVPEIRQLARASERAARFNYAEHARKLKVMQDNPELQQLAPFYQGPAMLAEIPDPQPAGAPSNIRSQADAILGIGNR